MNGKRFLSLKSICCFENLILLKFKIFFFVSDASDAKSTEVSAISKNEKQMHGNNSKIIRTITTSALNENQTTSSGAELNSRNNFILVRNSKGTDGGHFLLRTDGLAHSKNNILLEDTEGGKIGQ